MVVDQGTLQLHNTRLRLHGSALTLLRASLQVQGTGGGGLQCTPWLYVENMLDGGGREKIRRQLNAEQMVIGNVALWAARSMRHVCLLILHGPMHTPITTRYLQLYNSTLELVCGSSIVGETRVTNATVSGAQGRGPWQMVLLSRSRHVDSAAPGRQDQLCG